LRFALKSAPSDVSVFLNGKAVNPVSVSAAQGLRNYRLEENGTVRFSAAGYRSLEYPGSALGFEKRLTVPGSNAVGFVEALCDAKRRELWVSNMNENKVHIYDLDTLEYKTSMTTGGVFPKVIVQNLAGNITAEPPRHGIFV